MVAQVIPHSFPRQAGFVVMAGLLSAATLGTALLPSLTNAAALTPRITVLPRVFIVGVRQTAGASAVMLPRVIGAGRRTTDTRLAVKKATLQV